MKCRNMRNFILVLTICICGRLGVSRKQRVKGGGLPFLMFSLDHNIEFQTIWIQIRLNLV